MRTSLAFCIGVMIAFGASGCAHVSATTAVIERIAEAENAPPEKQREFAQRFEELMAREGLQKNAGTGAGYSDPRGFWVSVRPRPPSIVVYWSTKYYLASTESLEAMHRFEVLQKEIAALVKEVFGSKKVEWKTTHSTAPLGP